MTNVNDTQKMKMYIKEWAANVILNLFQDLKLYFLILSSLFITALSAQDSTKLDLSGRCFCDHCVKYGKQRETKKITIAQEESNEIVRIYKKKEFSLNEAGASIDTGQVYVLQHVRFVESQAVFIEKSFPELDQLVAFLKKNPTVKISIQGHVNGPGSPNTEAYQKLSEDRCQAVQMYLMEHGIKANRIDKKGFGNTRMIFPAAINEKETAANRRVEIIITAK
ncbi:MAG: OmpA family protein [Bacteroidetes bacterium]|nr:OmpA family protein [Bacteroidota bacterium]